MAKRMSIATLKRWWKNTRTQSYRAVSGWLRSVLRPLLRAVQRPQNSRSGFVLPTAALLLLVVSLVIAAVLLRTINRTEQVAGIRQEKALYNAATPAVERAKAKIEYMFTQDTRLPAKVPSQEQLLSMMLNNGKEGISALQENPYLLNDEKLIKINGLEVPAWTYEEDSNGDGVKDVDVAYSVTWLIEDSEAGYANINDTRAQAVKDRAKKMYVRSGPALAEENKDCPTPEGQRIERGWFKDPKTTAILHKNFQIDAFAASKEENGTVATLEVQQDRRANRANKWGAWFRNDLEIFPGPPFNWNGAMYTNGSVFVGRPTGSKVSVTAFLVSSPKSCIYLSGADQSEIRMANPKEEKGARSTYQGQIVSGLINTDAYGSQSKFHVWREKETDLRDILNNNPELVTINPDTDSVNGSFRPSEIALDPLALFTEDRTVFRGKGLTLEGQIQAQPETGPFGVKDNPRFINDVNSADNPKVDDTYRADDRYGPIPGYGPKAEDTLSKRAKKTGEPITGELRYTSLNPVADGVGDDLDMGLDGYWERRAWREGMRVITGQRLELGNDPLPVATGYAQEGLKISVVNPNNGNREHETIQRRALRDNPAAVQATAIYHYSKPGDPDLPVAALATTVHPGTAETLKRSAIFDQFEFPFRTTPAVAFGGVFGDNPQEIAIDFFTGRGTNGWEFDVADSFFSNAEVQKALRNLANFAGDPKGAFPPVQENGIIHPYPILTKWGNFSNLRRSLQNPTNPESLADKTNKHTAALTLGMLAYNLQYLEAFDYTQNQGLITDLDAALTLLSDTNFPNGEIQVKADTSGKKFVEIYSPKSTATSTPVVKFKGGVVTPEAYITALEERVKETGITAPERQTRLKVAQLARLLYLKEQTNRDRTYGFRASPNNITPNLPAPLRDSFTYTVALASSTPAPGSAFQYGGITYDKSAAITPILWVGNDESFQTSVAKVNFNCNFGTTGNNYFGLTKPNPTIPTDADKEKKFIRLASAICGINEDTNGDGILTNATTDVDLGNNSTLDSVKYPSLFYLFPKINHDRLAAAASVEIRQPTAAMGLDPADSYLTDPYIGGLSSTYEAITDLSLVALKPKQIANWVVPHEVINLPGGDCPNDHTLNNPNPNCSKYNLVWDGVDNKAYRVAFKDAALFNGREAMNVRVLNLDLELLKDEKAPGGDTWLAGGNSAQFDEGGIVYAFREDAVREDAIARPAKSNWNACDSATDIINTGCRTNVTTPQDPPVNASNGISPKPVDFYSDPDRRPYGFRLINGSELERPIAGGNIVYGMSFISDNPAYIQGDFNCHGSCDNPISEVTGPSLLEIPSQTLRDTPTQFYNRGKDSKSYANKDADSWRTTEVLVDAVTILSDNFCDGSIEDGIITTGDVIFPSNWRVHLGSNELKRNSSPTPSLAAIYGCQNANTPYTSYLNQNRPNQAGMAYDVWLRENPADLGSPIRISKNGNPMLTTPVPIAGQPDYNYKGKYWTSADGQSISNQVVKPLIPAQQQYVSAVLLSNQVPSRSGQSNGGLQNFPRFLESWSGTNLVFSGSLVQSNFSTSATAPFDLDAWEPTQNPIVSDKDNIPYYFPPNRLWGYDVGLQLVPPAPISSRLITIAPTRSEFYRELPVDDPYIKNLSCAIGKGEGC